METIKFCTKCDTVVFIDDSIDMKFCPRCGEAIINNDYKVPNEEEE